MSISTKNSLLLLFERPYEPVYFPKGDNFILTAPPELLSNRHRAVANRLPNRFGDATQVPVLGMPAKPSTPVSPEPPPPGEIPLPRAILEARSLPRRAHFSVFVPWHQQLAADLIELFMAASDEEELRTLAVAARESCNPELFSYALTVAMLHRPDTRDLPLPPLVHTMPAKFFSGDALARAYEEANLTDSDREIVIIPRNLTSNDDNPEQRLAYFREDIGINLHHWHWHLVFPYRGPLSIVAKDRRGEMFYYMHQQIIARYNLERFSVGYSRVRTLSSFREPIKEGYYSKLSPEIARPEGYAGRPDNCLLADVKRDVERLFFTISDLERWEARIYDAIHTRTYLSPTGERIPLTEETGIDVLGNLVEASIISPNMTFYGDLHNMIHYCIGVCHDPTWKHRENLQAMADNTTTMRDPAFYPLHNYVDIIFREFKHLLPPYTKEQLALPGLALTGMSVQSAPLPNETAPPPPGELCTFMQESQINLSRGLDFAPRGPVLVQVQHLQHAPFVYTFKVQNSTPAMKRVTVRVFLGPQTDERGFSMQFLEHKNFFVEVDKFVVAVAPGKTEFRRTSLESSITIPWEQTFRSVDINRPPDDTPELQQFSYCSCGWPQHMLLPRGHADGLPCVIFAMLTDFDLDQVEEGPPLGQAGERACKAAVSFCGLRDRLFPDRRPMGFPFDRRLRDDRTTLRSFVDAFPNMRTTAVSVRFTNRVLQRRPHGASEPVPADIPVQTPLQTPL